MPGMDRKLSQFFEGSPVEMAPGGTHHVPWSRRLLTVLLALGIFLTSFGTPAPARADEAGNRKLLAKFQQKADSFLPKGRVMFVARKDVMDAPEELLSRIMETTAGHGIATDTMQREIDLLQSHAGKTPFGFCLSMEPTRPASNSMPLTIILTNDPDCDAKNLLANLSGCAPDSIRDDINISMETINHGVLSHELGHLYQNEHPEIIPKSDNASYTRQLCELHSDLCLMVDTLHSTGNMDTNRIMLDARTLSTFSRIRTEKDLTQPNVLYYAMSEHLEQGFHILEQACANPETTQKIMHANEQDIMDIATTIFNKVYPSETEYNDNLASLALLAEVAPHSVQPCTNKCPAIIWSAVNAHNNAQASTPHVFDHLKNFLEQAIKASQSLQKTMTPEENNMLPPRYTAQTP